MKQKLVSKEELENLYWNKNLSGREIATKLGMHYSSVYKKMQFFNISVKVTPNIPNLEHSPELAYVLGALWGDAYATPKQIKLEVVDFDFAHTFNSALNIIFNGEFPVGYRSDRGQFVVSVSSTVFCKWYKSARDEILVIAQEFPREFVRGFADSEASPYRTKLIHIYNSNEERLNYISWLLLNKFGIESHVLPRRALEGRKFTIRGKEYVPRRLGYVLQINKKEHVKCFHGKIGFSIARKTLEKYIFKVDVDLRIDDWMEPFKKTRRAILNQLGFEVEEIIDNPSSSSKGHHFFIHAIGKGGLSDFDMNRIQFLLGDCQTRVKINRLRIEKRGLQKFWNKMYSIARSVKEHPCAKCRLVGLLREMEENE